MKFEICRNPLRRIVTTRAINSLRSFSTGERSGSVLRLSLPPKHGTQEPLPNRPEVSREPCRYRWTAMRHLRVLLDGHTPMRAANIVERYGEPTHPPVRATRLSTGQGLTPLALMPQATGPLMTPHHTRMNVLRVQAGQHVLATGCALDNPALDPLDPAPCRALLHLAIGQPWGPAPRRSRWAVPLSVSGPRGATSQGRHDGRRVSRRRLREERGAMPRTSTTLGVMHHDLGLLGRAFAPPKETPSVRSAAPAV